MIEIQMVKGIIKNSEYVIIEIVELKEEEYHQKKIKFTVYKETKFIAIHEEEKKKRIL